MRDIALAQLISRVWIQFFWAYAKTYVNDLSRPIKSSSNESNQLRLNARFRSFHADQDEIDPWPSRKRASRWSSRSNRFCLITRRNDLFMAQARKPRLPPPFARRGEARLSSRALREFSSSGSHDSDLLSARCIYLRFFADYLQVSQFSSRSSGHAIIPVLTAYSNIEKHGGTEIMAVLAERRPRRHRPRRRRPRCPRRSIPRLQRVVQQSRHGNNSIAAFSFDASTIDFCRAYLAVAPYQASGLVKRDVKCVTESFVEHSGEKYPRAYFPVALISARSHGY